MNCYLRKTYITYKNCSYGLLYYSERQHITYVRNVMLKILAFIKIIQEIITPPLPPKHLALPSTPSSTCSINNFQNNQHANCSKKFLSKTRLFSILYVITNLVVFLYMLLLFNTTSVGTPNILYQ